MKRTFGSLSKLRLNRGNVVRDMLVQFHMHTQIRNREAQDAYCSYYYRQLDGQSDDPPSTRIERLDKNAAGGRISAFVMDANCTTTGYPQRTNHGGKKVQLGDIGGNARTYNTPNGKLSLGPDDGPKIFAPHSRLDEILELADSLAK